MANKPKTTSVFKKSEFWVTVVTSISGLLMAFGVLTPEQANGVSSYAPNIIGAILALFSSTKFVGTQHSAKVEVFRAMCAMRIDKGNGGGATAQGVSSVEDEISSIACAAGL